MVGKPQNKPSVTLEVSDGIGATPAASLSAGDASRTLLSVPLFLVAGTRRPPANQLQPSNARPPTIHHV